MKFILGSACTNLVTLKGVKLRRIHVSIKARHTHAHHIPSCGCVHVHLSLDNQLARIADALVCTPKYDAYRSGIHMHVVRLHM